MHVAGHPKYGRKPVLNILEINLSPDYGGLELHTRDFSHWLFEQNTCRLFLGLQKNSRLADAMTSLQVPTLYFTSAGGKLPLFKASRLSKFLYEHQIDVIHIHWKNDLPLAALAKRLCKYPVKLVHTRQMNLPAGKQDPYHRFVYKSLDCFIAITDYILNNAKERLPVPEDKMKRIYYGTKVPEAVTPDRIAQLRQKFNISNTFSVALFGRISAFKAQHLLIEAVHILAEEGIKINAFIIGEAFDNVYYNSLQEKTKQLGLEEQIHFMDFYQNPHELMACFDCVVLTTKKETFGLVLIEAMQVGVAVVGSNAGGVPEIIDHQQTGLLFEPMSTASLAEAIGLLYYDEALRKKIALAGKDKALRIFNREIQFQAFYETLKAVVDEQ